MDLSLHASQGCPIAISNRVQSKLVSFGIIDQMAHKSQNNFCVKQACLMVLQAGDSCAMLRREAEWISLI